MPANVSCSYEILGFKKKHYSGNSQDHGDPDGYSLKHLLLFFFSLRLEHVNIGNNQICYCRDTPRIWPSLLCALPIISTFDGISVSHLQLTPSSQKTTISSIHTLKNNKKRVTKPQNWLLHLSAEWCAQMGMYNGVQNVTEVNEGNDMGQHKYIREKNIV